MQKKLVPIAIILGILFIVVLIVTAFLRSQPTNNTSDTEVLYGGAFESGYPYAGYMLAFHDNKLNICGAVYLSPSRAVTAAHCINTTADTYVGTGTMDMTAGGKNILTAEMLTQNGWDGKNSTNDLATITLTRSVSLDKFAEIGSPELGCNYRVVAYGRTEQPDDINSTERPRKSARICINRIVGNVFYLSGKDSGICFGDSGSPIFKENSNQLVGIVSAIITNNNEVNCHIANQAVAVRTDVNTSFLLPGGEVFQSSKAVCGADCHNQVCGVGLVCGPSFLCQLPTGPTCFANLGTTCDDKFNIHCTGGTQCITGKCVLPPGQTQVQVSATEFGVNNILILGFAFINLLVVVSIFITVRKRKASVPIETAAEQIDTRRLRM